MIGMDDDEAGGGWTGPEVVDKNDESIKAKFGIDGPQSKETVEKVFDTLHQFIQAGGLEQFPDAIKIGDWIDLEGGLAVDASEGQEGANGGEISLGAGSGEDEPKLRLVVVGINSFRSGKGSNKKYEETANDGVDHVVFHFMDAPGKHRMKATDTSSGGYEESEMRDYVTGNFLEGLEKAGVPEGVLWGPKRYVSSEWNGTDVSELSDLLWLPTVWELYENGTGYGSSTKYVADGETEKNQARLEYYTSNALCAKSSVYWLASVTTVSASAFCGVYTDGFTSGNYGVAVLVGCAPAFCVQ
jgi:hypothetical protein